AALEHKDKLAGDVPRLSIAFTEVAPETKLVVGGDVVDPSSTTDLEVDPGQVKIVDSAPSRVPFEKTITIAKGQHETVAIPALGYPIEDKGRATLGKIVTISGGAVLVTGIIVGVYAHHKYTSEFDNGHCMMPDSDHPLCTQEGLAATHSAKTLGWVGTGIGAAGIV